MLKYFRENAVSPEQAEGLGEAELARKIVVGEFARRERPTLVEAVYGVIRKAAGVGSEV